MPRQCLVYGPRGWRVTKDNPLGCVWLHVSFLGSSRPDHAPNVLRLKVTPPAKTSVNTGISRLIFWLPISSHSHLQTNTHGTPLHTTSNNRLTSLQHSQSISSHLSPTTTILHKLNMKAFYISALALATTAFALPNTPASPPQSKYQCRATPHRIQHLTSHVLPPPPRSPTI